jgi:hypothetical protein
MVVGRYDVGSVISRDKAITDAVHTCFGTKNRVSSKEVEEGIR